VPELRFFLRFRNEKEEEDNLVCESQMKSCDSLCCFVVSILLGYTWVSGLVEYPGLWH
jgi:hypothetical protein